MGGTWPVTRRDPPEGSPFPAADDPDVLDPILNDLEAATDVRCLARSIATELESTMWVVGKRRATVAATAVYVAGAMRGDQDPTFEQAAVADAAAVAASSIVEYRDDVRTIYEVLAASST